MRVAPLIWLTALTLAGSGCAPLMPETADYQQGFHDGYAACQRESSQRREAGPATRELKIANTPTLARPIEQAPEHGRILGFRESIDDVPAIVNTTPFDIRSSGGRPPVVINGPPPPFERARITNVETSPTPTRGKIVNVTPQ
jgi:hypothetical protein